MTHYGRRYVFKFRGNFLSSLLTSITICYIMFTVTQKPIKTQNKEELKMMYVNKKNGKVATVVSEDEKCKTVILEYEDNSTTCVTTSTLKRWWKKFEAEEVVETLDVECENGVTGDEALEQAVVDPEDAYVREVMRQKEELGIECPSVTSYEVVSDNEKELTDEQYAQIGKEIAEQAKEKAKKASQKARKASSSRKFVWDKDQVALNFQMVKAIIYNTAELTGITYEKLPNFILVKVGKKSAFEIRIGRTGAVANLREDMLPEGEDYAMVKNYYMPVTIRKYTEADTENLVNILVSKCLEKYSQQ